MVKRKQVTYNDVPHKQDPETIAERKAFKLQMKRWADTERNFIAKTDAERKALQRDKIRAWIMYKTHGQITTAEGYVMWLMKKESETK